MNDNPGNAPFDFNTAFQPAQPLAPSLPPAAQAPPPPRALVSPAGGLLIVTQRGQGLATGSLILAGVSALAVGVGLYLFLAHIELSAHPFRDATPWLTLAVVGVCAGLLSLAGAIVSEVRARPRTVATVALVCALVLPWAAALLGAKLGADAFAANVSDRARELGLTAAKALQQTLAENQIEAGPLVDFLMLLLN